MVFSGLLVKLQRYKHRQQIHLEAGQFGLMEPMGSNQPAPCTYACTGEGPLSAPAVHNEGRYKAITFSATGEPL